MTSGIPDGNGPDGEGRSVFKTGFILAAGFLAVVVVVAIVLVLSHGGGRGAAAPAPPAQPGMSSAPASPATGGCHPPDASQQVPASAPPGVTWSLYQGIAMPSSSTAGPMIVDGDVARCYARTPVGALIAAWQISTRYLIAHDWRAVTLDQTMPGPGRNAYLEKRAQIGNASASPGEYAQLAGFKFVTYTPAEAVIEVVTRGNDGSMGVTVLTVMWSARDWKLQLQSDGNASPSVQQVTSLDGYVPWGGV